jgi:3-phenylpropionate/trans-cinnamate dioxygenase ferredoxin subunit
MKPDWVFTIEDSKLPDNSKIAVYPKGLQVLLIKRSGQIYAISDKCAHMACSLASGVLEDHTLKCPCHDWKYDIRNGEFLDAKEIKIPVYDVKVSDGNIFVKVERET